MSDIVSYLLPHNNILMILKIEINQQSQLYSNFMKKHQQEALLTDYLNAIRAPTQALTLYLSQQLHSIEQTFDYKHTKSMEIIEQQQTDRQCEDEMPRGNRIKKQFNEQISKIIKVKTKIEQIINVYKREIKDMAHSLLKYEEQARAKKKDILQESRKSSKSKSKNIDNSKQEKQEDMKIRKPPEPVKAECTNCLKMQEDKNKWKMLSHKIQQFKKKNNVFQLELKHKQADIKLKEQQIQALKQKIVQLQKSQNSEREDEQRKKLKKDNTSLRGQKVLLGNQLATLKKQLAQKSQINDVQDIQIKKLRLQIENLNSSLNWHVSNLNQLRNSHKRGLNQEQREQTQKTQSLVKLNKAMARALEEQEGLLEAINNKTKRLEEGWMKQVDRYQKKINQMESILEDKNETIIKLKTSNKGDKPSSYQSDMIKVLNKKLAEKQQQIRNLQQQIESASQ